MEISYASFSKALGVARGSVTMAVKGGQLKADEIRKLIDVKLPENKAWIDKQISKSKTWDLNRISEQAQSKETHQVTKQEKKLKEQPPKKKASVVDEYQKKLRDLEYKRKLADLNKTNNANKLEEIRIKKLQGEVIP